MLIVTLKNPNLTLYIMQCAYPTGFPLYWTDYGHLPPYILRFTPILHPISFLVEQIPSMGSACCAKAGFLLLAEKGGRRHTVLRFAQEQWAQEKRIAPSVPKRALTHQKTSCTFPFLTWCIYTQENAAHLHYQPSLERLHFNHREGMCFQKPFAVPQGELAIWRGCWL